MAARVVLTAPLPRLLSPSTLPSKLIPRRGLSAGGDHHGPSKVNMWEDPLSPSKWKEEHFVLFCLSGWGLLFYGGYKLSTRNKNEKVGAPSAQ